MVDSEMQIPEEGHAQFAFLSLRKLHQNQVRLLFSGAIGLPLLLTAASGRASFSAGSTTYVRAPVETRSREIRADIYFDKESVLSSRTSKKPVQRWPLEVQIAQDSHVLLCKNGI